ncbi:DUF1569 domain-containing protein [Marinicella sp. S1101]|uniref:DUF1569 domain-containing protein n=1 Tax=Marinicella marina TaxID=2996016 RepID=UPI002260A7F2|nr:DUF1569 domain-containing protein [Marinicella marina]MCX7553100.1 DUF1569 domain-containing protein [Marinicella marina]MDJ1138832.1 DUF1569 domain-containing protein [Marinicella marina]
MKRRKLLKNTLLLTTAGVLGSGVWLLNGYDPEKLTIEHAIKDLQRINIQQAGFAGGWNLSQVLNHLAQSIEYSISGYPVHKSERFKQNIGQLAFSVFTYRGKMSHDLLEPIPGAPRLEANDAALAMSRLITALNDFRAHKGALKAHFAFGQLTHAEYTYAHVMHINNHLESLLV